MHRLLVAATLLCWVPSARAADTITTLPSWNGTDTISSFGVPNTATYGQTITALSNGNFILTDFTIEMNLPVTVPFRGEVYEWNGTRATGPSLFESGVMMGAGSMTPATFTLPAAGAVLEAGKQYVLFASTSKDQGGPSAGGSWGTVNSNPYAGGGFFFLNNTANPTLWTSTAWTASFSTRDVAFAADFVTPGATGSTTALTNPLVFGQPITAHVSGAPTGIITFTDGVNTLGTVRVDGSGNAQLSVALSVGTHTLRANYSGDGVLAASTSGNLSVTVNKANSALVCVTNKTPTVFGEPVQFTATVSAEAPGAGTPTGNVSFFDGATLLGTANLAAGVAALTTAAVGLGTRSISAQYNGSANFNPVGAAAITQTVNQAGTVTVLTPDFNPSVFGAPLNLTATVSAASPATGFPTGTVTFKDGSTTIGTATLSSGVATLLAPTLSVTTHNLTAVYGADANYTGSTSAVLSQSIIKAATGTALTTSSQPSVFGQPVTLTAQVTPAGTLAIATGSVTFRESGVLISTVTLNGQGRASVVRPALEPGAHSFTADYNGDAGFFTSSAALVQFVATDGVAVTVSAAPNPVVSGGALMLGATVVVATPGAGTPTGQITFQRGGVTIASAPLAGGGATASSVAPAAGTYVIQAIYGGDAHFGSGASGSVVLTVSGVGSSTELASSQNPSAAGASVTFTATVSGPGGTPTGSVTFRDGAEVLGTAGLVAGAASITASALDTGSHLVTASYGGDATWLPSATALTQVVEPPPDAAMPPDLAMPRDLAMAAPDLARPAAAPDLAMPRGKGGSDGGCGVAAGAAGSAVGPTALLLVVALWWARRRRPA